MERREGQALATELARADDIVREYLIFRGFLGTLKQFEAERKSDKVRGMQPERIVEILFSHITNFEPLNMIDLWRYLDARFFSRLDAKFARLTRQLERSLQRYYVVHCLQSGNIAKCRDFFEQFADDLCRDEEWRSWFALSFLRGTDNIPPECEPFFSKQWQDLFATSLYNFMATVIAHVPPPQIVRFDRFQRENATLAATVESQQKELLFVHASMTHSKRRVSANVSTSHQQHQRQFDLFPSSSSNLAVSSDCSTSVVSSSLQVNSHAVDVSPTSVCCDVTFLPSPLTPPESGAGVGNAESQTSPNLLMLDSSHHCEDLQPNPPCLDSVSYQNENVDMISVESSTTRKSPVFSFPPEKTNGFGSRQIHEFGGYKELVQLVRFSGDGSLLATCTKDQIKVFHVSGSCSDHENLTDEIDTTTRSLEITGIDAAVSSFDFASDLTCADWNGANVQSNKFFLTGHLNGAVKIWNPETNKCVREIFGDGIKRRVDSLCANPMGTNCVISSFSIGGTNSLQLVSLRNVTRPEVSFDTPSCSSVVRTMDFNHNGSCFVVAGEAEEMWLFDVKCQKPVLKWNLNGTKGVDCLHWGSDETSVFAIGANHALTEWSIHKGGQQLCSISLPPLLLPQSSPLSSPQLSSSPFFNSCQTSVMPMNDCQGGWDSVFGNDSRYSNYFMAHDFSFAPDSNNFVVSPPCSVFSKNNALGLYAGGTVTACWSKDVQMSSVHWHPTHNSLFCGAVRGENVVRIYKLSHND